MGRILFLSEAKSTHSTGMPSGSHQDFPELRFLVLLPSLSTEWDGQLKQSWGNSINSMTDLAQRKTCKQSKFKYHFTTGEEGSTPWWHFQSLKYLRHNRLKYIDRYSIKAFKFCFERCLVLISSNLLLKARLTSKSEVRSGWPELSSRKEVPQPLYREYSLLAPIYGRFLFLGTWEFPLLKLVALAPCSLTPWHNWGNAMDSGDHASEGEPSSVSIGNLAYAQITPFIHLHPQKPPFPMVSLYIVPAYYQA